MKALRSLMGLVLCCAFLALTALAKIGIDYQMSKTADGWKVYDVMVAGVSLVNNYRDTFTQEIKAGGIDGLIKSLHAKNVAADAGKK